MQLLQQQALHNSSSTLSSSRNIGSSSSWS